MIRMFLSFIFLLIIKIRLFLYQKNILKSFKYKTKVISVGNISFGGTGKTPLVLFLANKLSDIKNIAVIEKGYKSGLRKDEIILTSKGDGELNKGGDEVLMLWAKMKNGIKLGIGNIKYKVLDFITLRYPDLELAIIDDGFQHLKIKRDIDIVLIDSEEGFNNKLFPTGSLREPYSSLKRADILIFSKTNFLSIEKLYKLKNSALEINKNLKIFFTKTKFYSSIDLNNKKILPVSAIGNADYFHKNLRDSGAIFEKYFKYPDHYNFKESDLKEFEESRKNLNLDYIVFTSKDIVKVRKIIDKDFFVECYYEHVFDNEDEFLKCLI